jgi:hypothetical protein
MIAIEQVPHAGKRQGEQGCITVAGDGAFHTRELG